MTPILYEKDEIEFTSHGLGDLTEIYDVDIHEQRNGLLQLTASYPVSGISYDEISVGRVILAKPNQRDDNHAFRIVRTELDISGYAITIEADSITYDLTHNLVKHLNVDSSDGQTFMNSLQNAIVNPSIFTFYSDVSTVSTTKLDYINPMEAIMGTTGSFLQFWGGELKRENRRVAMFNRRGRDNVSTFRLGKNIAGLKYTVDIGSLVTRIIPTKTIQSDDQAITLEGTPVDSKYINSYEQIYTLIVDFTDDKIKTVADLNATAKNWFTASTNTGVDLPNITVDIDVLSLQDSSDYQDKFKNLESVSLTDTVTVYVPEYGVNVTAIVNELHYDPIQERVTKLTVGTAKQSFADSSRIQLSDLQNKIIDVKNQADSAVVNANGKNTNYYGSIKPSFPQEGDLWYWINGDQSGIRQFVNGDWVSLVDSDTEVKIAASVDAAVAQAQSMDAALNQSINDNINEMMTTVNTSLAVLDSEAAVFKSEADSATSSVASSVSALMTTTTASLAAQGSNAVSTANQALATASSVAVSTSSANSTANSNATKALSQASSTATSVATAASIANSNATKAVTSAGTAITNANTALSSAASALSTANASSLATSSVASDVSGLKANYTSLNSSAGVLSSQTASLAVSASSASAQFDKVSSTTGSLSAETAALKISASSASAEFTKVNSSAGSLAAETASLKISASSAALSIGSVQSSAGSLASDAASLKVSASSAALSVSNLTSSAGSLSAKTASLAVSASSFATAVTSMSTENGSQATSISSLKQRADGFDLTVSKVDNLSVGGRNYVRYSSGLNGSSTAKPTLIGASSGSNVTVTYPSDGILMTNGATNTTTEWYYQIANAWANFSATPMVPGKQYTFSAEVMGTVPQAVLRYGFNGGTGGKEGSKNFDINNTSWTRISLTIISTSTNTGLYFRIQGGINNQYANGWAGGETLKFRYVKIEDGNVPTAWSPAPEDVDAVTGSLASDTSSLKLSASSATLDISHVASSAGSLATDTASLKVSASSAALSISSTQSTASSTATQATSLAVSASSAAVAISNVQSSAGSLSAETSSLKLSASSAALSIGNVQSSAGSLATETAALKVSASSASAEFTKVNSSAGSLATQAASLAVSASSAAIGISNVTSSAGSLATQTASLAVSASSFSTSITSMASQNGSQATAISALTQRADGFDLTVSKVDDIADGIGGRNYVLNSSGLGGSSTTRPTLKGTTSGGNTTVTYPSDGILMTNGATNTTGEWYYQVALAWTTISATPLIPGKTYTFSAEVMGTVPQVVMRFGTNGTGGFDTNKMFAINNTSWTLAHITITPKTSNTGLFFRIQGGINNQYTSGWSGGETLKFRYVKIEDGSVPTAWSAAPEDIDAQFATQKITIDGITSTVSKQTTDINAVTTRVQTAEGSISTAQNNITGLQTSQTQTANQLQTEITDRTTGDANTLTQAKSFTTSQITSYDTGIQSQFTQTSNAILASIESTNLVVNSEFDPLDGTWYAFTQTAGSALGSAWSAVASSSFGDWPVVNGSRVIAYSANQWYSTALKPTSAGKAFSASIVVGRTSATADTTFDFQIAFWDSSKKLISSLGSTNPVNGSSYVAVAKYVTKNITSPTGTAYVSLVIAHSSGNAQDFITRPMLNYGAKAASYSPTYGTTSSSTVLSLMKDNYSFGINANGQLVSGMSGNEELLTLTSKAIHLSSDTTVDGSFYALGGNFKNLNASEIKTGTINASLINVINLNANNITTGAINGANLTINLDTGQVVFQKGRIYSADGRTDINIDSGYISTANSSARILLTNGQMQFVDPTIFSQSDTPYFKISNDSGIFNGSGALVSGKDTLTLGLIGKDSLGLSDLAGVEKFYGINLQSSTNMTIGGADQGLYLSGGATFDDSTTLSGKNHPYIFVGSNSSGGTSNGDRVYISSRYTHSPSVYQRTNSASANVYVASDGALVRSSSASRFKLNIEYETDASTAEQLLTLNPATWDDKFETEQTDRLHETGEETDIAINKRRYYGIIAEDLVKANLDYLVQRNEQTNEVDGVEYAKIGVALIPIVRELRDRINEQALEIERLKEMTK